MSALILGTSICLLFPTIYFFWRSLNGSSNTPRACKKYGSDPQPAVPRPEDQQHPSRNNQGPIVGCVESLYVHPIKSCRAVRVEEAVVFGTGLKYDRNFTFAEFNAPDGKSKSTGWKFITQRRYPKLANIRLEIWVPHCDAPHYSSNEANVQSGGVLRVRYPDLRKSAKDLAFKTVDIPYDPTEKQIAKMGYTMEELTVWKDRPNALLMATTKASSPKWIQAMLNYIGVFATMNAISPNWIQEIRSYIGVSKPLALFRVATGHERQVFRNAPSKEQLGYQSSVGFVDAYPLHILGLSSVADLDRRLADQVPDLLEGQQSSAPRFRANIYCEGPEAYAEDSWKRIRIGESIYYVACRTTRCELPNTDQWTGETHGHQPSKLIRGYRNIDEGAGPSKACMGMQMVPAAEQGLIKIGDEIEVLEIGAHRYINQ
ncbi:MAG: hypothetical protein Q9168_004079 [Polycauliona sp. 1 TL-2023]